MDVDSSVDYYSEGEEQWDVDDANEEVFDRYYEDVAVDDEVVVIVYDDDDREKVDLLITEVSVALNDDNKVDEVGADFANAANGLWLLAFASLIYFSRKVLSAKVVSGSIVKNYLRPVAAIYIALGRQFFVAVSRTTKCYFYSYYWTLRYKFCISSICNKFLLLLLPTSLVTRLSKLIIVLLKSSLLRTSLSLLSQLSVKCLLLAWASCYISLSVVFYYTLP